MEFEKLGARKQDKILLGLWTRIVKTRAHNFCERCGRKTSLNAHHIYGRTNYNVRYDPDNGVCLCSGCHTLNRDSAHNAPMEFIEYLIEKRHQAWFQRLRKKAMNDVLKPDKVKIYGELKEEAV